MLCTMHLMKTLRGVIGMSHAIAELWRGSLNPVCGLGKNKAEMKHLEQLMRCHLGKLDKALDEDVKGVLERYNDCINEYIVMLSEQSFCDGYSLGSKITAEALIGAENML